MTTVTTATATSSTSSTSNAANAYAPAPLPADSLLENSAPDVRRNTRTGRPPASRSAMNPDELSPDRVVVTLKYPADGTAEVSNSCSGCGVKHPLPAFPNCATSAADNDRRTTTQPGAEADAARPVMDR